MTNKINTKSMIQVALLTALIAIGAFIRIPLPITVFTMQFIFVLLSGLLLGSKKGALSCLLYVLIGLFGFPVFTEGGGPLYIIKPTFGYLIAFILAAFFVGFIREKYGYNSFITLFIACVFAMIFTYLIGSFYTYIIFKYVAGTPLPYWTFLASLFPITAIKDLFSCAFASIVAKKINNRISL